MCNATWDGEHVNFFQPDASCIRNKGEVPSVIVHELGHGLDENDGSAILQEKATGEANGDILAALTFHDSCIGAGARATPCTGFGNACTSCTGVRDIDWARHVTPEPDTVDSLIFPRCDLGYDYAGPCGRQGHCESQVVSEAVWDFVNRDFPEPDSPAAWNVMERLWFVTRPTATRSYGCNTTDGIFTTHGCNVGSLWKVLRVADDDDGNLANGTPHGGALFAAFDRHSIACQNDPGARRTFAGCTPPPTPLITTSHDVEEVRVKWENWTNGVVFDLYRNDHGCDAGFTRISKGHVGTAKDLTVVNGNAYSTRSSPTPPATPPVRARRRAA